MTRNTSLPVIDATFRNQHIGRYFRHSSAMAHVLTSVCLSFSKITEKVTRAF